MTLKASKSNLSVFGNIPLVGLQGKKDGLWSTCCCKKKKIFFGKSFLYIKRNILSHRASLYLAPRVRMRRATPACLKVMGWWWWGGWPMRFLCQPKAPWFGALGFGARA